MGQSTCVADYRSQVSLLDGRCATIRPILSSDRDQLRSFFGRLGPETMFLRFHYAKPLVSEQEVQSYCECDRDNTFTLVALIERGGRPEIVGVGRYDRLPTAQAAEVAFVVEDGEQGNGIGTHLLALLAVVGKDKGLLRFVAETVTYNEIMLSIFRKYDRSLKREVDGDSCRVTFSITPPLDSGRLPMGQVTSA